MLGGISVCTIGICNGISICIRCDRIYFDAVVVTFAKDMRHETALPDLRRTATNSARPGCVRRPWNCAPILPAPDTMCPRISGSRLRSPRPGARVTGSAKSWHASSSADNNYEIFIRADIATPIEVLALLVKELVHTVLPDGAGHGKEFREAAMKIGLLPPMREARPAPHLVERLEKLAAQLGPLPHDQLNITHEPLTAINPANR